jgi:hypothetical protein
MPFPLETLPPGDSIGGVVYNNNNNNNNNNRRAVAINTSFLQYTSLLSESSKIPPLHLPYTVTPIYSHSHIQSLPYTATPHIQSLHLLYQYWLHGRTITTVTSVRIAKLKDELLSQDCPLDHEFLFIFFIQSVGHQMFRIFQEMSFWG